MHKRSKLHPETRAYKNTKASIAQPRHHLLQSSSTKHGVPNPADRCLRELELHHQRQTPRHTCNHLPRHHAASAHSLRSASLNLPMPQLQQSCPLSPHKRLLLDAEHSEAGAQLFTLQRRPLLNRVAVPGGFLLDRGNVRTIGRWREGMRRKT